MTKSFLSAAVLGTLTLPLFANADTIGFEVGINLWQQDYQGSIQAGVAGSQIDVEDDLGFDSDSGVNGYILLEHPLPLIPNIKVQQTELKVSETNRLDRSITFDGVSYNASADVKTTADLSHTDATLYYEILDNWVSVDLGLTARVFNDGVTITDQTNGLRSSEDLDGTLPMLYAAVKFELPLSGLYVGGDINWIDISDDSLLDYRVNIGYESDFGLGIEAGFRSFELELEDDDDRADLTIDGAYAGIFYHF